MFDIGAVELLVIVIVAILVIGPSEMPRAMRTAGRWIGQVRKVSAHFRTGIDAMVREAELEDMEKKWKAQNEAIMKRSAEKAASESEDAAMTGPPPVKAPKPGNRAGTSNPVDLEADDPVISPDSRPPELPLTSTNKIKGSTGGTDA